MDAKPKYDGDLQMFVVTPRTPNPEKLRWMRWLVEQGRIGHGVAGPISGPYDWAKK